MDHFCYLCSVSVILSCLIIAAWWSPAGKGLILTSWLSCMLSDVFLCSCHFLPARTHFFSWSIHFWEHFYTLRWGHSSDTDKQQIQGHFTICISFQINDIYVLERENSRRGQVWQIRRVRKDGNLL